MEERVLILDFGSQYTQLLARRIRELNVYSEIVPYTISIRKILEANPIGIIFSGGPQSVYGNDSPSVDEKIYELGIPILGICYGMQLMCMSLGGRVTASKVREYGDAEIENTGGRLFNNLPNRLKVWMSHGDEVTKPHKGFVITAKSRSSTAAIENGSRKLFGLQFHPEVAHTPLGKVILRNFLVDVCRAHQKWRISSFIPDAVKQIKDTVGNGKAICALSGGVDSSVAAALVARAIGRKQVCIFVNNGLLRQNEYVEVLKSYKEMGLNIRSIDASKQFLKKLRNIIEPEQKRKIIGNEFIKIFETESRKLGGVEYLVQGTLYPDVIESNPVNGPSEIIKSHHNVGGLPERMSLKLIEPLRELFKDEVRELGKELGVPSQIVDRQPFPGPGLAVRIVGDVTDKRLSILREADKIVRDEMKNQELDKKTWQSFAVLLPVFSVGVKGDQRTYEHTIVLRAVNSTDGMTADWAKLPDDLLQTISSRITSEVKGVNRVVYDISSKPPATIEWE